jgi:hypothetical protein
MPYYPRSDFMSNCANSLHFEMSIDDKGVKNF